MLDHFDPELAGSIEAIAEVVQRRPGICAEAATVATDDRFAAWAACLRDEGEPAAAEAVESLAGLLPAEHLRTSEQERIGHRFALQPPGVRADPGYSPPICGEAERESAAAAVR